MIDLILGGPPRTGGGVAGAVAARGSGAVRQNPPTIPAQKKPPELLEGRAVDFINQGRWTRGHRARSGMRAQTAPFPTRQSLGCLVHIQRGKAASLFWTPGA